MPKSRARRWCLLIPMLMCATPELSGAQRRGRCAGTVALPALAGGAVGAWLGFIAAKIKLSDWDAGSHSPAAQRTKRRAAIGGALVGVAVGSLLEIGSSCARSTPLAKQARTEYDDAITLEEITRRGTAGTVYELVFALRPNWLNLRGVDALTEGPQTVTLEGKEIQLTGEPRLPVYLDDGRLGALDQLKSLPTVGVQSIRHFTGPQATYRWGRGHSHGAIQVVTSLEP